jgi:hypothetical protein
MISYIIGNKSDWIFYYTKIGAFLTSALLQNKYYTGISFNGISSVYINTITHIITASPGVLNTITKEYNSKAIPTVINKKDVSYWGKAIDYLLAVTLQLIAFISNNVDIQAYQNMHESELYSPNKWLNVEEKPLLPGITKNVLVNEYQSYESFTDAGSDLLFTVNSSKENND